MYKVCLGPKRTRPNDRNRPLWPQRRSRRPSWRRHSDGDPYSVRAWRACVSWQWGSVFIEDFLTAFARQKWAYAGCLLSRARGMPD